MIDIEFTSYGNTKFKISKNEQALASQLGLFLICRIGELKYNTEYGLDYDLLLNHNLDNSYKENHIKSKLKRFFSKKIKNIVSVKVEKLNRNLKFKIIYISIYSEEVQSFEI